MRREVAGKPIPGFWRTVGASPPAHWRAGLWGVFAAMGSELTGVTATLRQRLGILPVAGRPLRLGMPETSRIAVAAALAAGHEAPTLLLVTNPARTLATAEEAGLYLEHVPVFRLPEREGLPYEFARTDSALTIERARALAALAGTGRALVVASWAALSEHCAGPETKREGIDLAVGGAFDPTDLLRALEASGYEVSYLADRPGTAARRGGIVDVFLPDGDQPLRVEFFGSEIESIRVVDLTTQRSIERLKTAHLPPAAGGGLAARSAAAYLARTLEAGGEGAEAIVEQLELLGEGGRSDLAASLEAVLFETSALAHLDRAALVVIEDEEDGQAALARQSEYEQPPFFQLL